MTTCNYCQKQFKPRPQVKHPKACNDLNCQRLRQRDNEQDWHQRHREKYDNRYHDRMSKVRREKMLRYFSDLLEFFRVGSEFLNVKVNFDEFLPVLKDLCFVLGIRRLNKLWSI